jgi:hypothetical protein
METLFSTVAQLSFTIVGLFFVALTVDSDSRNFWLGDKALNKYVTVNFFILLLPGLLSVSWLVPFSILGFPAWLYIVSVLFFMYFYVYSELLKFYKSKAYRQIADYESAIDVKKALKFGINGLAILTVVGVYDGITNQPIYDSMIAILGIYLFLLVLTSVIPVYVFLRKGAENKYQKEILNNQVAITPTNKPVDHNSSDTGIFYLVVLVCALISFFIGKFLSKD